MMLPPRTFVAVALLLLLVDGAFTPARVEAVPAGSAAQRARDSPPPGASQRIAGREAIKCEPTDPGGIDNEYSPSSGYQRTHNRATEQT